MFNYDIKAEISYVHAHKEIEKYYDFTEGWEDRLLKSENWQEVWNLQRINNMHYAMQGDANKFLDHVTKMLTGKYKALLIDRNGQEFVATPAREEKWKLKMQRNEEGALPLYINGSGELISILTGNGLKVEAIGEA